MVQFCYEDHIDLIAFYILQQEQKSAAVLHRLARGNTFFRIASDNSVVVFLNGQMVINIMLSVNQAECDRTSERIKAVLDYKRSIGEVTSGRCACYGYRVINRICILYRCFHRHFLIFAFYDSRCNYFHTMGILSGC